MAKTPKEPEKDSASAVSGVDSLSDKQQHEQPEALPFEPDTPPSEMSGGAEARFWRAFQREIAKVRPDFAPERIEDYWQNEAKTHNADSMTYLREIEAWLKKIIGDILSERYGDNWEVKGLPRPIYMRAKSVAEQSFMSYGV